MENINLVKREQPKQPLSMNPQKFVVWLFIVSIVMMFAGWTSTYVVAQSSGAGVSVELPNIFAISTVLLLLSSVSMHMAYRSAKKDQLGQLKLFSFVTLGLGVSFLLAQFVGFGKLVEQDVYFVGASAIDSFTFVLPFMHGVHIIAGLIYLLVIVWKAYRFKVHSKNMASLEMCATFWHFLDVLWLYLFLFLQFN